MAEQNSDILEVLIRQIGENAEVNPILSKALGVLGQAELFEPICDLLHCEHPRNEPLVVPVRISDERCDVTALRQSGVGTYAAQAFGDAAASTIVMICS